MYFWFKISVVTRQKYKYGVRCRIPKKKCTLEVYKTLKMVTGSKQNSTV